MGLGQFRPTRDYDEHEIIPNLLNEVIPDDYYWDKTEKRGEKWAKMARAFILRTERTPQDRFTQAANQVGEEISRSAETVKSALTRETFDDEAGVEIPREVLIRVEVASKSTTTSRSRISSKPTAITSRTTGVKQPTGPAGCPVPQPPQ